MSWCDKLASTPVAGFKLEPIHAGLDKVMDVLSPMIRTWRDGERVTFDIDQSEMFSFNLNKYDGYVYGISPARISVQFKYRLKSKAVSGGPPTVEMTSQPRPYTELLPEASKRLVKMATLLLEDTPRKIERVGVSSITGVALDEAPPGIREFIDYVGAPWNANLEEFNFMIVAPLKEGQGYKDRCVHILTRNQNNEGMLMLQLDWQRVFNEGRSTTADSLLDMLQTAEAEALKYFEDLAEGSRFDEELIRATRA